MKRVLTMDAKKGSSAEIAKAKGQAAFGKMGDVKAEFKKISWTSKDELKAYTKIVVGASFVFGIGIYVVDLVVRGALQGISHLLRAMLG